MNWYCNKSGNYKEITNSSSSIINYSAIDEITVTSTLLIPSLTKENEGIYKCTGSNNVENFIDAVASFDAVITIQGNTISSFNEIYSFVYAVPPTILPAEEQFIGVQTYDYTLRFIIRNDSPSVQSNNIHWYFTDLTSRTTHTIEANNGTKYRFTPDRLSLTIFNVTLFDRGNYTIRAGNEAGIREFTSYLDVHGMTL